MVSFCELGDLCAMLIIMSGGVYEVYYYSWYKFHRITPDLVLELNLLETG